MWAGQSGLRQLCHSAPCSCWKAHHALVTDMQGGCTCSCALTPVQQTVDWHCAVIAPAACTCQLQAATPVLCTRRCPGGTAAAGRRGCPEQDGSSFLPIGVVSITGSVPFGMVSITLSAGCLLGVLYFVSHLEFPRTFITVPGWASHLLVNFPGGIRRYMPTG